MKKALLLSLASACLAAAGCSQPPSLLAPRAFNRPARVAFVCFADGRPVALSECDDGDPATTAPPAGHVLYALVPQQPRGEVAAVDLAQNPPRVIDSDRRVPGFTFVAVGEIPIAIGVSERQPPHCAFVANRGSRDLWAIQTVRFVDESRAAVPVSRLSLIEVVQPGVGGGGSEGGFDADGGVGPDADAADGGAPSRAPPSGRPSDLVLIERSAGSEIFVTLPEDGRVLRIAVASGEDACGFGSVLADLDLSAIAIPEPAPGESSDPSLDARLADPRVIATCSRDVALDERALLGEVPRAASIDPPPDPSARAMPIALAIERAARGGEPVALWIGDGARPMVYRYDLGSDRIDRVLRTDGPVHDLAVTPPVEGGDGARAYLYAIDARDGTVMVLDLATSHVVPAGTMSALRPDRVQFRVPARALEVIDTLHEPVRSSDGCSTDPTAGVGPAVLRGVFVAVALANGAVAFVDVMDADGFCRAELGGDGTCADRLALGENVSFVRRHRPRIADRLASAVALDEAPRASIGSSSGVFGPDGSVAEQPLAPLLCPVGTCDAGLGPVFPSDGSGPPRMCAVSDPWSAEPESWSITWEGPIPSTFTNAGLLRPGAAEGQYLLESRGNLCALGVLGPGSADGVSDSEAAEYGYEGDVVAVRGELPAAQREDARCRALVGLDVGDRRPILVPMQALRVGDDGTSTIELDAARTLLRRTDVGPDGEPFRVGDVVRCFGDELVSFEVRAHEQLVVVGSRTGFLHRVVRDTETGRCVVDETLPTTIRGRARFDAAVDGADDDLVADDCPADPANAFVSTRLRVALAHPTPGAIPDELAITFRIGHVPAPLQIDVGAIGGTTRTTTLPSHLTWSPIDQRLYVVDEGRRGLVIVDVDPLGVAAVIE